MYTRERKERASVKWSEKSNGFCVDEDRDRDFLQYTRRFLINIASKAWSDRTIVYHCARYSCAAPRTCHQRFQLTPDSRGQSGCASFRTKNRTAVKIEQRPCENTGQHTRAEPISLTIGHFSISDRRSRDNRTISSSVSINRPRFHVRSNALMPITAEKIVGDPSTKLYVSISFVRHR